MQFCDFFNVRSDVAFSFQAGCRHAPHFSEHVPLRPGAIVQAEILFRQGFDTWQWEDEALLRAFEFLEGIGWQPEGDDLWMTSLVNARYGTDYLEDPWAWHGKNVGWTAWTHQNVAAGATVPEPGTLLLLVIGTGVSGLVWTIRRRWKR